MGIRVPGFKGTVLSGYYGGKKDTVLGGYYGG